MSKQDQKYIKIKTEGNFNLQDVASEFNLSAAELIAFHNQHCTLHELLPLFLPKYVEYIYLPPQNFVERYKKLLKSTKLSLPKIASEKNYGVIINFLPKELSIHYKIKVKRTPGFLEITKEKTYVNNREIEQTIEQLFEKAEKVLYPLQLSLSDEGAISKIQNNEEIAKRWRMDCRPKLEEYYQSETSDQILSKLDNAFINIDVQMDLLQKNIFYKLFFLTVFQSYPQFSKSDVMEIYFPSIGQSSSYEVEFVLSNEFTRGNKIALQILGFEEENLFNMNAKLGKVDLLYKFEKESMEIFSITGFISTFENNIEYQISFQLFDLRNNS